MTMSSFLVCMILLFMVLSLLTPANSLQEQSKIDLGHNSNDTENQSTSPVSLSGLKLYLSVNSTKIQSGNAIGIYISVNNTLPKSVIIDSQDMWSFPVLPLETCSHMPVGISVLAGYYMPTNITGATQLPIHFLGMLCPPPTNIIEKYEFSPLSSEAKISQCAPNPSVPCPKNVDMKYNISLGGYWKNGGMYQNFEPGIYTIIGGDGWGQLTIQHFVIYAPFNTSHNETSSCCIPESSKSSYVLPLEQFKSGIAAKDVVCINGLTLVIKTTNGYPACVTSNGANILIERGWGRLP